MNSSRTVTLNTGAKMPMVGLGTWNVSKEKVRPAVEHALLNGYSHIDCAHVYENEDAVGAAFHSVFSEQGRNRDEVFITSKLWNNSHAKDNVLKACKQTLKDLQLEYLDLYLMHFGIASPAGMGLEPLDVNGVLVTEKISIRETWEAMEELVKLGLVKAIGVSNFTTPMLVDLLTYAKIVPAVNQIELHPYLQQTQLMEFCARYGISVTAYSPLGSETAMNHDKPVLRENETVMAIAKRHHVSSAQLLLQWGIQRGTVVLPRSASIEHIDENLAAFDVVLSDKEMIQLAALERGLRYVDPYEWWRIPYFG
jgi:diketogulonate reductase-like aldo/keto reductase